MPSSTMICHVIEDHTRLAIITLFLTVIPRVDETIEIAGPIKFVKVTHVCHVAGIDQETGNGYHYVKLFVTKWHAEF